MSKMTRHIVLLVFLLVGCNTLAPNPTRTPAPIPNITIDTPEPTVPLTPTPSLATPVALVSSATPAINCANAPSPRLIILERGKVTETDQTLNVRAGPGTDYAILTRLADGAIFFVLDGVVCEDDFLWYKIQYQAITGWIAEGDVNQYYAEPYLMG